MTAPSTPSARPGPARSSVLAVLLVAALLGFLAGALAATTVGTAAVERAAPTTAPTIPATPGPTGSAPPVATPSPDTAWSLAVQTDRAQAAPRELIRLSGRVDPARADVVVAVQRSRDGGPYEDFPVTTTTADDGTFGTWVRTQRVGTSQFRVVADVDGESLVSNVAVVEIG